MPKQNCYLYTRVSTAMQVEGFSLDAQKDKLRKYAEFQDLRIVGEYTDEGKSGKNIDGRPEFQRIRTRFPMSSFSNCHDSDEMLQIL